MPMPCARCCLLFPPSQIEFVHSEILYNDHEANQKSRQYTQEKINTTNTNGTGNNPMVIKWWLRLMMMMMKAHNNAWQQQQQQIYVCII